MKKIIGIIVVLLIIAFAALPAIIGPATESGLRDALAESMAQQNIMEARVTNYQRGYRSATARIEIGFSDNYLEVIKQQSRDAASDAGQTQTDEQLQGTMSTFSAPVPVTIEIEHGPLLTKFASGLGLNSFRMTLGDSELLDTVREMTGVDDLLEITGRAGMTGNGIFDIAMPALEVQDDVGSMSFAGLTGSGTYDVSNEHAVVSAISDGVTVNTPALGLVMEKLSLNVDSSTLASNLGIGTSSIELDRMRFTDRAQGTDVEVVVDGFSIVSDIKLRDSDGLIDVLLLYSLDSITTPEFGANDISMALSMAGLKPDVFDKYEKVAATPLDDPAQWDAMVELAHESLGTSPTLQVGPIKFKTDGEFLDGILKIDADADELPDLDAFDLMDPSMWMNMLYANLDVKASEALVHSIADGYMLQQIAESMPPDQPMDPAELDAIVMEQRPVMLEQFIEQGFIIRTAEGYAVKVDFKKGEMKVNGNPFPIEALLGP